MKKKTKKLCPVCAKEFSSSNKFCSRDCTYDAKRVCTPEIERAIVMEYYASNLSMYAVGEKYGVSVHYVSRMRKRHSDLTYDLNHFANVGNMMKEAKSE